ncbi:MAG: cytochrome C oxidase subunit IV family protein [Bacteroidia bacterium]|nr:cytochrome C oxidase subunit IV family protein [Bacteroidia bacterium]
MSGDHEELPGYYTGDIHNQYVPEHRNSKAIRLIWITFTILLIATIVEVGISFTGIPRDILNAIFIVLTIFKAYYIVAIFMHLKSEKLGMGASIVIPFLFILYFVIMMILEGNYLNYVK